MQPLSPEDYVRTHPVDVEGKIVGTEPGHAYIFQRGKWHVYKAPVVEGVAPTDLDAILEMIRTGGSYEDAWGRIWEPQFNAEYNVYYFQEVDAAGTVIGQPIEASVFLDWRNRTDTALKEGAELYPLEGKPIPMGPKPYPGPLATDEELDAWAMSLGEIPSVYEPLVYGERSAEGIPLGMSREQEEATLAAGYPKGGNIIASPAWNEFAKSVMQRQRMEEQAQLSQLPPEQWQDQWTGQRPLTWTQTPNWAERWAETRGDVWPTARRLQQGWMDAGALIANNPMLYGLEKGMTPTEVRAAQGSPWASTVGLNQVNPWIQGGRAGPAPWATPPKGWGERIPPYLSGGAVNPALGQWLAGVPWV